MGCGVVGFTSFSIGSHPNESQYLVNTSFGRLADALIPLNYSYQLDTYFFELLVLEKLYQFPFCP